MSGQTQGRRASQFYPKADEPRSDPGRPVGAEELTALLSAAGWTPDHLGPAGTGTSGQVWSFEADGRRLVAKVQRGLYGSAALAVESGVSHVLADANIHHAMVRDLIGGGDITVAVMDRLDGPSLREADGDEAVVDNTLAKQAAALRAVHSMPMREFGLIVAADDGITGSSPDWGSYLVRRLDEHLRLLRQAAVAPAADLNDAARALRTLQDVSGIRPRLLHGDSGPHNWILTVGGPVPIDWEDAVAGDPLFEFAQWATFQPIRRWPAFLDAALDGEPTGPLFDLYFLRIVVAKVVVRLRLGIPDAPGRPTVRQRFSEAWDRARRV